MRTIPAPIIPFKSNLLRMKRRIYSDEVAKPDKLFCFNRALSWVHLKRKDIGKHWYDLGEILNAR